MTLHEKLKRAICCPSGTCSSPADCYATSHRDVPVKLDAAAKAVARVIQDAWRKQAGPWSRERAVPGHVSAAPEPFCEGAARVVAGRGENAL